MRSRWKGNVERRRKPNENGRRRKSLQNEGKEKEERKKPRKTHRTIAPEEKYLPSSGNTVSSDLAISRVVSIEATNIQRELKAM